MKNKVKVGGVVEYLVGGIFFFTGVGLLIGAIIAFVSNQNFKETSKEIEAIISEITSYRDSDGDKDHDVWVTYRVDGREYTEEISFYSSSMYEGKAIDILVDMNYPTRIRSVSGNTFVVWFLGGMGLVFTLVGGCVLLVPLDRKNKTKKLLESGHYVYATVTGGYMNTHIEVNGRNPYRLECEYEDVFSGVTHKFKSENIWVDPMPYVGREIRVYCNRDFSGSYYVDIDSLHMCI